MPLLQLGPFAPIFANPVSVVLVVVSLVLLGGASAVFGYLSLRGVLAALTPD